MVGMPRCGVRRRPFTWQIHARGRRRRRPYHGIPPASGGLISNIPSAQVAAFSRIKLSRWGRRLH